MDGKYLCLADCFVYIRKNGVPFPLSKFSIEGLASTITMSARGYTPQTI
jgi:hypothetical protein